MTGLLEQNFVSNFGIVYTAFAITIGYSLSVETTTSFSFTISSTRNSTGHRHVKCDISIPENRDRKSRNLDEMQINVQQGTHIANNKRNVHFNTSFTVHEPRVPPSGYELVRGLGWYRMHLQPLTWEEARLACEAEGAHLAVLNSKEEADALKGIFARAPKTIPGTTWNTYAFIGFSDIIEGQYITIFGDTLNEAGFNIWESGQPNNAKTDYDPDQDCGGIFRDEGTLNDLPCRAKLSYFCEYSDVF